MLLARTGLVLFLTLALTSTAMAQRVRLKRPRVDAEKSVLEATLVAKEDTYVIPAGQQGKEFAEKVSAPDAKDLPEPPKVDIVLQLKNPTEKPITILLDSDAGALDLKLEGPGAVTVEGRKIFTREFRGGKKVEIAPGKTHEIPITALRFGFRGVAQQAYWTEPGDYKLFGVLRWPDPAAGEGGKRSILEVTAEPVKLTVKAAK
jgi:hypothetical protein